VLRDISNHVRPMKSKRKTEKSVWVSIVGARPQFVKLGPICRAIEQHNLELPGYEIDHHILNTGQHYDREVAALLFDEMNLPEPNYSLKVGSGSHGTQIARMLARMEPILSSLRPDWVIVYGDTNSTIAGAILASRLKLPLAHVEAGCRSDEISQPEEQNRIVADHLSQLLLPVSDRNAANLRREGIGVTGDHLHRRISVVGDVQYDALLQNADLAEERVQSQLDLFQLKSKDYYLLTLHRAENTDDPERLRGILELASSLDLPVLFPVHPRTKEILARNGVSLNGSLRVAPPQGYLEMVALEKHARKILTDSGGIQKEAFYLNVPCVTLRERTEWVETVELGANRLVGSDPRSIQSAVYETNHLSWEHAGPYGDGSAARKIVAELSASRCCLAKAIASH
jgi:UDP-GlcNAc3NAcA epimerase